MLAEYLLFLFGTWIVSQTVKFLVKLKKNKFSLSYLKNSYLYYSGAPSSHAALIVMTLFFIADRSGLDSPSLLVAVLFSIIWLFEIYMQRKRFNSLVDILGFGGKRTDYAVLKELNGHDFVDIIAGAVLGGSVFIVLNLIIF